MKNNVSRLENYLYFIYFLEIKGKLQELEENFQKLKGTKQNKKEIFTYFFKN